MASYQKFEDLPIWQTARVIAREVYRLTSSRPFAADRGLSDQIRRASASVMSNIAEGFERATKKDFIRFLSIAKASLAETRSQLYLALDLNYLDESTHTLLNEKAATLGYEIGGFMRYLDRDSPPEK